MRPERPAEKGLSEFGRPFVDCTATRSEFQRFAGTAPVHPDGLSPGGWSRDRVDRPESAKSCDGFFRGDFLES